MAFTPAVNGGALAKIKGRDTGHRRWLSSGTSHPNEMRPGVTEKAQRVIDAVDAVEAMADPEGQAKAICEVLADHAAQTPRLR
jgi:hypothetical protein